jgi:hypothetical protein
LKHFAEQRNQLEAELSSSVQKQEELERKCKEYEKSIMSLHIAGQEKDLESARQQQRILELEEVILEEDTSLEAKESKPDAEFSVSIASLAGEAWSISGLGPNCTLADLRARVAQTLKMPQGSVQLLFGTQLLETPSLHTKLEKLGIVDGSELTYVRQQHVASQVKKGMRVLVKDAGNRDVQGEYICQQSERPWPGKRADLCFARRGSPIRVPWYAKAADWPAGWYFETGLGKKGIYFHPADDAQSLPCDLWERYVAEKWSSPGELPGPTIEALP